MEKTDVTLRELLKLVEKSILDHSRYTTLEDKLKSAEVIRTLCQAQYSIADGTARIIEAMSEIDMMDSDPYDDDAYDAPSSMLNFFSDDDKKKGRNKKQDKDKNLF